MELDRVFYKWYKKIDMNIDNERAGQRWIGIQNAEKTFECIDEISELIKMYYRISFDVQIKERFIDCFANEDKTFDETNEEEIVILIGGILAKMLEENEIFVAFSIRVLDIFYDTPLKELSDMADRVISDMTKETKVRKETNLNQIKKITSKEIENTVSENGTITSKTAKQLVDIIKKLNINIEKLVYIVEQENRKCQENTEILSWIMGEWSNILNLPLSKVNKRNGSFVIGAELADLVKVYPGPFSYKAFLKRMLDKCIGENSEITLTEFIDSQNEEMRLIIAKKYGKDCKIRNLPMLSAVEISLSVDGAKVWVPVYKKAWKIDPDRIKLDLLEWTEILYQECMMSTYR